VPDLLNINEFHRLYRANTFGDGLTTSTVYLYLPRVRAGRIRVLTHVTVESTVHGCDTIRLGIENGGVRYYLDELKTVAAAELCVSRSDILLGEGDRFFAELQGTTTGAKLTMTCVGWTRDL